jgi:TRAP-type C4-dicarboxylate transport system permease small subunit
MAFYRDKTLMLKPLARLLRLWDRFAPILIVIVMAAMVAIVAAQVFLRYLLNDSIGWADEVSRLTFVWLIFLAIPLGIKAGVRIGIELLTSRLPASLQDALARSVAAVAAGLMLLVCYESVVISWQQWDELMISVDLSAALFYLAVAAGSAHSALHLIWIVLSGAVNADQTLIRELE